MTEGRAAEAVLGGARGEAVSAGAELGRRSGSWFLCSPARGGKPGGAVLGGSWGAVVSVSDGVDVMAPAGDAEIGRVDDCGDEGEAGVFAGMVAPEGVAAWVGAVGEKTVVVGMVPGRDAFVDVAVVAWDAAVAVNALVFFAGGA